VRSDWLSVEVSPGYVWAVAAAYGFLAFSYPVVIRVRLRTLADAELVRVWRRMAGWVWIADLALIGCVAGLVPGVTRASLGLTLPTRNDANGGIVITMGAFILICSFGVELWINDYRCGVGALVRKTLSLPRIAVTIGAAALNAVGYVALPLLVLVGGFGLPVIVAVIVTAFGYGWQYLPHGGKRVATWTALAGVAVAVEFMTASVLMPFTVLAAGGLVGLVVNGRPVVVRLTRLAPPPAAPPPVPPLTVISQPEPYLEPGASGPVFR
jgi:hypothetical protein